MSPYPEEEVSEVVMRQDGRLVGGVSEGAARPSWNHTDTLSLSGRDVTDSGHELGRGGGLPLRAFRCWTAFLSTVSLSSLRAMG